MPKKKTAQRDPKKTVEENANTREDPNRQYEEIEGFCPPSKPDAAQFGAPPVVRGHQGIDELDYYHGLLPREDVNSMLQNNGEFLVRNTEIVQGAAIREMCLSVKTRAGVLHFPLKVNDNGLYAVDQEPQFTTIVGLLEYFHSTRRPFSTSHAKLLIPVPRNDWELLHHQVKLGRKIGEGAFGAVFLGTLKIRPKDDPISVAVKVLKCTFQTKEKIEELMCEARLMRELDHVNIVRCYGVAAEMEPLYIVFELIDGGGLDKYLQKRKIEVPIEGRLQMCRDAAVALEYVHFKGIIHCDIAARNCLYGEGQLKLSDFGMSKRADNYVMAKGDLTPVRWTAPEVFRFRTLTPASDVWALGVLFWEIFNNAAEPYTGMTGQMARDQVINNRLRLPTFPDWVPPEMNSLMDEIFEWEPERRIRIAQVVETMEKICRKHPFVDSAKKALPKKPAPAPPPSSSSSDERRSKGSRSRATSTAVGTDNRTRKIRTARASSGSKSKARPLRKSRSTAKKER